MSSAELTDDERFALVVVMTDRYDNVVETRRQTGDTEYDQDDEDQCSVLTFALSDRLPLGDVASWEHLHDAIWIGLETPEAYPDVDPAVLRAAADKVDYEHPEGER